MSRRRTAHEALCCLYRASDLDALEYLEGLAEELDAAQQLYVSLRSLGAYLSPEQRHAMREFIVSVITRARIIE